MELPYEEQRIKEVVEKYGIDVKKLEQEQEKLSKLLVFKDSINFDVAERIAGIETVFAKNKIISAIVVLQNGELVEQEYFEDKIRFPYIPGLRAYRELPSVMGAFNKLDEKPDLVFIKDSIHPRKLGMASHFSVIASVPVIGISDSLIVGEIKDDSIFLNNKIVGKVLRPKVGANPIYVSPGNMISLKTSVELTKKMIKEPHKFPEPLRLARKYAKEVLEEVFKSF